MFDVIYQNVTKHITLTENEALRFYTFLKPKSVKRKQIILKAGDICHDSIFVSQGCLKGYNIDEEGQQHVLQFAPANWWIADMYSLISQRTGHLNIDALEDSELLFLSRKDQERLFFELPQFERFFRLITEKSLVSYRQRVIDTMSLTAQERYQNFCTVYPTLIHNIPQKYIASYIGVTQEFLSKMKNHQT
jgi:CRP-like cAMP-binding protein